MANEEHLARLKQGVEVWNKWMEDRAYVELNLNLKEAKLREKDLSKAKLIGVDLRGADLGGSKLIRADLSRANLEEAYLIGTDLTEADLRRTNLTESKLSKADLTEADLRNAYLVGADLIRADLSKADLREASLSRTQALGANFEEAEFTGACLENWNINSQTNLKNVICNYVYLKEGKKERRPHNPNKNFAPGEFTKLFQKALETVDLIFSDGIDWQVFLASFQNLQVEYGSDQLAIQAIEKKLGDAFVIRVEVPPDADKASIEDSFWQKYKPLLEAKDEQIAFYRQEIKTKRKENTRLIGIIETMAEKENRTINAETYYEQSGNLGIGHNEGEIKGNAKVAGVINEAEKQNLAEAAAEIQRLLKQLEETNPSATQAEQQAYVTASTPPTLKRRFVSALQAGWKEAIKEFLDNPYVNVGVAILEGWQEAD